MIARQNLEVKGFIELENESGVINPVAGKGRLYKKPSDPNLYWRGENYGEELNVTSPSGSVFAYITRVTQTITSGSIYDVGATSGKYNFSQNSNAKIFTDVYFQSGDQDTLMEVPYYDTLFSSISGNVGTLNIFASGSNLYIQNNYTTDITLNYYRNT